MMEGHPSNAGDTAMYPEAPLAESHGSEKNWGQNDEKFSLA